MQTPALSHDLVWLYWLAGALVFVVALFLLVVVRKGRSLPGQHVFKASRLSRGNRLLPAQVSITPDSITLYQPHIAHVSSIKIDTNLVFSDVLIETTGGHHPIVCHGHTKGDAVRMKQLIEKYQSERYGKRDVPV
jgi:hypothetical protein